MRRYIQAEILISLLQIKSRDKILVKYTNVNRRAEYPQECRVHTCLRIIKERIHFCQSNKS